MNKTNKRGQMKLSFGMIFSIFLIIAFIAFAIFVILKFLNLQSSIQIETFQEDLQEDINDMWQSQQGSREVEYTLPDDIYAVCFIDDEYENLVYESDDIIDGTIIENIDIEYITSEEETYCIANNDGTVTMTITKDYGETLVKITR